MARFRQLALRAIVTLSLAALGGAALAAPTRARKSSKPATAVAAPAAPAEATAAGPEAARLEMLPGPPADGIIRTPEGFIRLEGPPVADDGARGAFGTYRPSPARTGPARFATAAAAPAAELAPQLAPPPPPVDPCRAERNRYVRRLLSYAGIDLENPLALAENLAGPYGSPPWVVFSPYGFLPGVDPLRPLAWDQELRSLARDLAACGR